ncbi:MAG: 3-keto-5-aminohexanoate cleavage protein [Firmicutes bacterium]|nr:3-keto-5-aminohexanoate cleavage protein [Bacillota bacterium]MBQ3123231.1 3-keto-5-aminohexanoate cleavage protein [Bacillota bacterium]MBQ9972585.1 3-keto-5-aminohexanoate cleavage protein [Bacillota bacterium]
MEKLIITAAICGMGGTKEDNPAIPYTIEELAREAKSAFDAGASVIHMHVRNDDGSVSFDKARYQAAVDAVEAACPGVIIIQPADGGAVDWETLENYKEGDPVKLPEMFTLPTGTCNWGGDGAYINEECDVFKRAGILKRLGIVPDLESFDKGMIDTIIKGNNIGLFDHPAHFDFILGVQMAANVRDLTFLSSSLPHWATFTATGIGPDAWHIAASAILLGGHVRVGFEDSMFLEKGVMAKSNGELVEKVATLAKLLGREIATPDEARKILGIIK